MTDAKTESVKLTLIPAQDGEKYDFGNGFSLPLSAHAVNSEQNIDLPVFDTTTDYKWQLRGLQSRLKHPDSYARFEDVEDVKRHLIQWLTENNPEPKEARLKAEFEAIIRGLTA